MKPKRIRCLNYFFERISLLNRYISALGEMRNHCHFPYSQDKLTIYDAIIGLAGDISDFGDNKEVIVLYSNNINNL